MRKAFIVLFLVLTSQVAIGQKAGLVSGIVKDKTGNYSLPGASLKLDKHNRYTISDQNGYFEFLNVPAEDYTLEVTYIGYTPNKQQITVKNGTNNVVDILMEENSLEMGAVVVMGDYLRGQSKAINQQKTNSNISNVISSDQVGRFPDSNIGDALKRVAGVTMQNDQGEARNIIIRGLAPELNSVTLNGNRIPSAEGDNRNVQMDLIPADMISNIEVSKTLTSDMDADAIGGSVDLVTRAAPNKQRISATISGGYLPIREKGMYSGSFIYGNRFLNNKLGVVVSGSLQNKKYGSDNIEAEWSDEGKKDQVFVSQFDIRKYDVQRIRRSISSSLDFKINDNNFIVADIIYNWRDDRENRYRTRYRKIKPTYDADDNISGYTGDIRRETKGGLDNGRNKNTRLEDQRVQNYTLHGQHLLSEKLDLDWNLSYSKASEDRPNERYMDFEQKKLSFTQDLSNPRYPLVSSMGEDMDKMSLRTITENHNYTEEDEYSFKINTRIPLSVIEDQKGRLRLGIRGRFKEKERDNIFYSYKPLSDIGVLSAVPTSYYDGKNFVSSSKYTPGMYASASYLGKLNLKDAKQFTESLEPLEYLPSNYKAKERILAGYARWDQNFSEKALLILGVRVENTHIDYTGNDVMFNDDEELVVSEKDSRTKSYWNIFPNITFKYNIKDDFIIRSAFTTALARPNYYNLVPYKNINIKDDEMSVGNPDLKATYSYNIDLMAEYYFRSVGLVSVGVFYKNLQNFIYQYTNVKYSSSDFTEDYPELENPIAEDKKWKFNEHKNGRSVNVFGLEAAFQRKLDFLPTPFLKNMAVYLNYTYTWSKTKGIWDSDGNERKDIKLPGTAPHMFNASLAWENNNLSARISLNYTSDYIDALGSNEFYDSYYDKQLFLDANVSYKFNSHFRIFAEANNLTNQALRYYQGSSDRVMQLEYYKPSYNFGIKYDF